MILGANMPVYLGENYSPTLPSASSTGISMASNDGESTSKEAVIPTIDGLMQFLDGSGKKEITQDKLNPSIFTVKEANEKAYWFLNSITKEYQLLANYSVENTDSSLKAVGRTRTGKGASNAVCLRLGAETLAIRRLYDLSKIDLETAKDKIEKSNLILSLLYSMPNHQEMLKSINIGFIKSSSREPVGFKTIIPAIDGGTLTQLFGAQFSGVNYCGGSYGSCYANVSHKHKNAVGIAKTYFLEDLDNKKPLVDNLKQSYYAFCDHIKSQGYFIKHFDVTPYNVMYNNKERCLTLVDGESWEHVNDEKAMYALLESDFDEIAAHH